jgi:hypothetical protein
MKLAEIRPQCEMIWTLLASNAPPFLWTRNVFRISLLSAASGLLERLTVSSKPSIFQQFNGQATIAAPFHGCLAGLLILVQHYELRLADDVPLIRSLNGLRGEAPEVHVRRYGLTPAGELQLQKMIADPALNPSALDAIFHFIRATRLWTNGLAAALRDRALSVDSRIQGAALFTLTDLPQSTEILAGLAAQKIVPIPESLLNELVDRGHRPTIERRLSQLIDNPTLLAAGEVDFPNSSPLDWIGEIRERAVWNKLQRIRGLALDNRYFRVVGTVTAAMAAIDETQLIGSMASQIRRTPKAWRPWPQTGIPESRHRVRAPVRRARSPSPLSTPRGQRATRTKLGLGRRSGSKSGCVPLASGRPVGMGNLLEPFPDPEGRSLRAVDRGLRRWA